MENKKRDDTATLAAQAHGVTPAYVRMVVGYTNLIDPSRQSLVTPLS